jgi:hypothetical protein
MYERLHLYCVSKEINLQGNKCVTHDDTNNWWKYYHENNPVGANVLPHLKTPNRQAIDSAGHPQQKVTLLLHDQSRRQLRHGANYSSLSYSRLNGGAAVKPQPWGHLQPARRILVSASIRLRGAADAEMTVFIRASVCVWGLLQWGNALILFFFFSLLH